MLRLLSYNVNGIRSAMEKGLISWLDDQDFDIVCLQETKAQEGNLPVRHFESLGYEVVWHSAQRKPKRS